jgi:hypothetical protein
MLNYIPKFKMAACLRVFILLACFDVAFAGEEYEPVPNLSVELAREETRDNLKFLLGTVLEKTSTLQGTYGGFSPYGAALFLDGSVKYVWFAKPGQIVKDPAKSIPFIRRALQSQVLSGKIVGSAVIYKTQEHAQGALQLNVELEYQTGLALAYASEMAIDADNKITWGNSQQVNFQPRVFFIPEENDVEKVADKADKGAEKQDLSVINKAP